MTYRSIPNEVDSIYHIYNRGVNKGLIFFSDKNYEYFVYKMSYHFHEKASILAYCLMPNHYHLLVKVLREDFVLNGLRPFILAYIRAVNNEQERVGPLFQSHYQSNIVGDEGYLLECVQYIHLNPVKAGMVAHPQEWEYSSYRSYFSTSQNSIIDTSWIYDYFDSLQEFSNFSSSLTIDASPKSFNDYS